MGAEDAAAELADIGDDERGAEFCPCNVMSRLGVVDHSKYGEINKKARQVEGVEDTH